MDPEQARTDSRWLYIMAWKAAPAKKAVRARRWNYHACITGKSLISENYRSYKQITSPSSDLGKLITAVYKLIDKTRQDWVLERTEKHPHDAGQPARSNRHVVRRLSPNPSAQLPGARPSLPSFPQRVLVRRSAATSALGRSAAVRERILLRWSAEQSSEMATST